MTDEPIAIEPDIDSVLLDVSPEGVAVLTLNRPDMHNAINDEMVQKVTEILEDLDDQDGIRVLMIDGAGESFSSGDDIKAYARDETSSEGEYRDHAGNVALMLLRLRGLDMPTVGLVHGAALATGLGLLAACDIVVATADAQFGLPETRLGLIPAASAPYLAEAIGIRQTRRYALTGERFGAEEAQRLGLVTTIVPDQAALSSEAERIVSLLLEGGPEALSATKELLDLVTYLPADEDLADETASMFAERRHSDEAREGIEAAVGGRKPSWIS